ncbi:hypothetical protein G4Y79_03265 [Phototrophicus methaneseepsis]|uniref:Uncharacterized protein n=1 Tax=Phototrophicus methaneseepsis TaxID=2710758 RepID=A0A7S8IFB2_9CHLR|nr:hypothetical protein [Phototrophicus methaneseepsis]QPC83416.1 hypothetical protein G4Y79_03265 [Phototrophicus methaneseepsis]
MPRESRFWRTDANGNLLNDANIDFIKPPFDTVVEDVVATYTRHIAADIHSIYVMASVARGIAEVGSSDVDTFAVLEEMLDPELVMQDWLPEAPIALQQKHSAVVSDVEMELWPYGYVLRDPEEFSPGAFIIKTQAVCVWGSDLAPELPDYNLNDFKTRLAIANEDIVLLEPDIEDALAAIETDPSPDAIRSLCKHICKHMARAGFSLTMTDNAHYTRDVALCIPAFIAAYPQHSQGMQQTGQFIAQPTDDADTLRAFLESFGAQMVALCEAWLDEYNPERYDFFVYGDDPDYEAD